MQRLLMMLPGCLRLALLCAGLIVCSGAQAQIDSEPRVPYVTTPQDVVDRMLAMAGMTTQDYLIDLGSGDGRVSSGGASDGYTDGTSENHVFRPLLAAGGVRRHDADGADRRG